MFNQRQKDSIEHSLSLVQSFCLLQAENRVMHFNANLILEILEKSSNFLIDRTVLLWNKKGSLIVTFEILYKVNYSQKSTEYVFLDRSRYKDVLYLDFELNFENKALKTFLWNSKDNDESGNLNHKRPEGNLMEFSNDQPLTDKAITDVLRYVYSTLETRKDPFSA